MTEAPPERPIFSPEDEERYSSIPWKAHGSNGEYFRGYWRDHPLVAVAGLVVPRVMAHRAVLFEAQGPDDCVCALCGWGPISWSALVRGEDGKQVDSDDKLEVDHINRKGWDCRRENLRATCFWCNRYRQYVEGFKLPWAQIGQRAPTRRPALRQVVGGEASQACLDLQARVRQGLPLWALENGEETKPVSRKRKKPAAPTEPQGPVVEGPRELSDDEVEAEFKRMLAGLPEVAEPAPAVLEPEVEVDEPETADIEDTEEPEDEDLEPAFIGSAVRHQRVRPPRAWPDWARRLVRHVLRDRSPQPVHIVAWDDLVDRKTFTLRPMAGED